MVVPCSIPSVLDRQWFHAEWGTLMVHLGLVPDSPGSENPTASFSSGSAVPLSYIIYLPDWTLICRSVLAHPPTDREREKKSFRVRLRVGGKAKKTWLSVNFTSGFFLWACAVHIPKRNWLEKKINNVQSRTHIPTPSFCIQPGFVRAPFLEFVRFFFFIICLFLKLFCNSFFPFLFRTSVIILRFRSDTLVFVELYFLLYKFHIHGAPLLATESIMIFWKITFFSSALIHILSKM